MFSTLPEYTCGTCGSITKTGIPAADIIYKACSRIYHQGSTYYNQDIGLTDNRNSFFNFSDHFAEPYNMRAELAAFIAGISLI
jgi:hypothetical protein